jgi:hypothetical protein
MAASRKLRFFGVCADSMIGRALREERDSIMRHSLLTSAVVSGGAGLGLLVWHGLDLLHRIDFVIHLTHARVAFAVTRIASTGAAAIALALTTLFLACVGLIRKVRSFAKRAKTEIPSVDSTEFVEQRDELEHTTIVSSSSVQYSFRLKRTKRYH